MSSASSFVEQLLDLARLGVAVGPRPDRAEDVAQAEDRPHRVADGVVELACLLAGGGHGSILARASSRSATTWPRPARPRRCRPGSRGRRTPSRTPPVREATPPGVGPRPPGRGDRRRTAAARRPIAARECRPAGPRARWRRRGRAARSRRAPRRPPGASAPRGDAPASSAAPPRRVARLAHPVPLGEGEGRGLHRPAVHGWHQEARSRRPPGTRAPERPGSRSPSRRTRSGPGSSAASGADVAEQPGARAGRGGQHDRVGPDHLGVAGRADDEVPAATRAGARGRGRSRRCAPIPRLRRRPGRGPPAAGPPRHGGRRRRGSPSRGRAGGLAAAAARDRERSCSSSATSWGTAARAEISRACPAYTPPSSGSTSRSTTSLPRRSSTRSPTLTSRSPSSVAGSTASMRRAGHPLGGQHPLEGRAGRAGHPSSCAASAPAGRGSTGSPRSSRGARGPRRGRPHGPASTASGRRLSIASAPTSTRPRRPRRARRLPPIAGRRLQDHDLERPGRSTAQPVRGGQARDAAADDRDPEAVWCVGLGHARTGQRGTAVSTAAAREPSGVAAASQPHDDEAAASLRAVPVRSSSCWCSVAVRSSRPPRPTRRGRVHGRLDPELGAAGAAGAGRWPQDGARTRLQAARRRSPRAKQPSAPMTRAVISTGQVTLHAKDSLPRRGQRSCGWSPRGAARSADEQTSSDDRRPALGVAPSRCGSRRDRFDEAMDAFGALGEVEQQQPAVRGRHHPGASTPTPGSGPPSAASSRSRRCSRRAEKLGDIIAIESDLARRQADLDSLKPQQAYLADQTSLSTINVYLCARCRRRPPRGGHGVPGRAGDGWHALGGATVVAPHRARRRAPVRVLAGAARRTAVAGRTPPPAIPAPVTEA